jgi:hypothetical protein
VEPIHSCASLCKPHQVQHAASLDVVILRCLVIVHLLARKDEPAGTQHTLNWRKKDSDTVCCSAATDHCSTATTVPQAAISCRTLGVSWDLATLARQLNAIQSCFVERHLNDVAFLCNLLCNLLCKRATCNSQKNGQESNNIAAHLCCTSGVPSSLLRAPWYTTKQ